MFRHFSSKQELCEKMFIASKKSLHKTLEKKWDKNSSIEDQLHYLIKETSLYYLANLEEFDFNYSFSHSRYMTDVLKAKAAELCDDVFYVFNESKKQNIIINENNAFLFEMINGMLYSLICYISKNPNENLDEKLEFIYRSIKK